jgi:hypothetical protein
MHHSIGFRKRPTSPSFLKSTMLSLQVCQIIFDNQQWHCMDMIVETLPYIMNYSFLQILINHFVTFVRVSYRIHHTSKNLWSKAFLSKTKACHLPLICCLLKWGSSLAVFSLSTSFNLLFLSNGQHYFRWRNWTQKISSSVIYGLLGVHIIIAKASWVWYGASRDIQHFDITLEEIQTRKNYIFPMQLYFYFLFSKF